MKSTHKVLLGMTSLLVTALPISTVVACRITPEIAKTRYRNVYNNFNSEIEKNIQILKAKKQAIENEKDATKLQQLKIERQAWVKSKTPVLQELRKKVNDEYNKLKQSQSNSNQQLLKIVHTNDEHGRLKYDESKLNNYSGMQGLAEILNKNFDRDLLLSAGDLIQGLPLSDSDKGMTISKVAHKTKYDAVAIGNHEFDWGLPHMFDIENATEGMPFLSASVFWNRKAVEEKVKTKTGELAKEGEKVFTPYIVKEISPKIKAGIVGITTPDTAYTSNPKNSVHVRFEDPVTAGNKAFSELKQQGVNFIVAITHLGVNRPDTRWDAREFATKTNEVDLILDGHSHTLVPHEEYGKIAKKTYLTQAEAYTKYLSELDIVVDAKEQKIVDIKQELRTIEYTELLGGKNNTITEIKELIDNLELKFNKENDVVVFNSPIAFKHADNAVTQTSSGDVTAWRGRVSQTNLGAFASDGIAWEFIKNNKVDSVNYSEDNVIGLINGGGLRQDIAVGNVKKLDLLGFSPFGNRITAVKVKGSTLIKAVKHGASKVFSGGYAQYSSNVKANINITKADGNNRVYELDESSLKINDKPINKEQEYVIVTNDFLLIGGDGYTMLDYTKNPNDVKHVYEGNDLLQVYIDYGKHITTNQEVKDGNLFEKRKIQDYNPDIYPQNIIVNHKLNK